jgi:non-specific protein-tyrosine kinase
LVTVAAPRSGAAEAYRDLRTTIRFLAHERSIRAVQVTRPGPRGDHTVVLANLAVSCARADQSTTMVCCDLRRPELHTLFGTSNDAGLTSVMLADAALSEVSQPIAGEPGLLLVPAGPLPPNPSELLSGVRADEIFDDLFKGSDLLLVDSPPVLPITDAAVLAQRVDATIVVVTLGTTTKRDLADGIDALARVNAPLAGTVVLRRRSRRPRKSRYSSPVTGAGDRPTLRGAVTAGIKTEKPKVGNGRSVGSGEAVTPGRRRSS